MISHTVIHIHYSHIIKERSGSIRPNQGDITMKSALLAEMCNMSSNTHVLAKYFHLVKVPDNTTHLNPLQS